MFCCFSKLSGPSKPNMLNLQRGLTHPHSTIVLTWISVMEGELNNYEVTVESRHGEQETRIILRDRDSCPGGLCGHIVGNPDPLIAGETYDVSLVSVSYNIKSFPEQQNITTSKYLALLFKNILLVW